MIERFSTNHKVVQQQTALKSRVLSQNKNKSTTKQTQALKTTDNKKHLKSQKGC